MTETYEEIQNRIDQLDLNEEDIVIGVELQGYHGEGDLDLIYEWDLQDAIEEGKVHHYELTVSIESYSEEGDSQKFNLTLEVEQWFDELSLTIEDEFEKVTNSRFDYISRESTNYRLVA